MAAIPEELFESEFFGHVKGAFTGAIRDRLGRFELADGGTLFLDEAGEIPPALQAKLLRVLQEGQFERVGGERTRTVDVRVVAATNRDLKREVEAGRFRQDLFYRLSVFPIELPPLRERREDIPILAEHFLNAAAKKMNLKPGRLTKGQVARLCAGDWPGNVRELQNVIERALILCQGGPLQFDLPASPARFPQVTTRRAQNGGAGGSDSGRTQATRTRQHSRGAGANQRQDFRSRGSRQTPGHQGNHPRLANQGPRFEAYLTSPTAATAATGSFFQRALPG